MRGPKNSKIYTKLVNEGPQPSTEINTGEITQAQRRDGVRMFRPRSSYQGTVKQGGGVTTPIYYLEMKHSPEGVIREWLNHNQKTLDEVGKKAVHWRICKLGEEWKEASREILGPFPELARGSGGSTVIEECPMCESEIGESLASHLPECPEA